MSIILGITGSFEGYVSDVLYLFNKGTWSNLSTTGLTQTYIDSGCSINVTDSIKMGLYATTGTRRSVRCAGRLNQTVDLSSYNYIKANVSSFDAGAVWIGISTSITNGADADDFASYASIDSAGVIILNISNITGKYYIYVRSSLYTRGTGSTTYYSYVNQLFLSKN